MSGRNGGELMVEPGYEVAVEIQLRWRDLDPLGHVNNAVFASYIETARVAYFRALHGDVVPTDFNIILARVEIDYLAPILLTDRPICRIGINQVGHKSFVFDYLMERATDGKPLARARSVQVCYDYAQERTVPVSDAMVQRVTQLRAAKGLPAPQKKD
jgi:acyl-CoA thioester hydrolase